MDKDIVVLMRKTMESKNSNADLGIPQGFPHRNMDRSWRKLRSFLKEEQGRTETPWIDDKFVDWLVYEGTIDVIGLHVESITEETTVLCAHCEGVQSGGICLDAFFEIPTSEFTQDELTDMMFGDHRYPCPDRFTWYPSVDDVRLDKYRERLEWWYDPFHDEED